VSITKGYCEANHEVTNGHADGAVTERRLGVGKWCREWDDVDATNTFFCTLCDDFALESGGGGGNKEREVRGRGADRVRE
jgi:hypothetical protein